MKPGLSLCLAAALLAAGGLEPRAKPEDYGAHARTADAAVGAELLGRYLPGDRTSHMTGDYVVVEVGFFPAVKGKPISLSSGHFRLRLNGKRDLAAQSPGIVAGGLRNPQWDHGRGVTAAGGVGPAVIVMRPERRQPRFPGDPQVESRRGGEREPEIKDGDREPEAGDAALRRALPETPVDRPAAGLLYFAWNESLGKLKSIGLVYDGPAGKMVIALK